MADDEAGYTLTEGSVRALADVLGTTARLAGGKLKTATMGPPMRRGGGSSLPPPTFQGMSLVVVVDGQWGVDFIRSHAGAA